MNIEEKQFVLLRYVKIIYFASVRKAISALCYISERQRGIISSIQCIEVFGLILIRRCYPAMMSDETVLDLEIMRSSYIYPLKLEPYLVNKNSSDVCLAFHLTSWLLLCHV